LPDLSLLLAIFLMVAFSVFIVGLCITVWSYWSTPAPLKVPLTPAPRTYTGVAVRLLKEIFLFASLFRASKWTWIFSWLFHAALIVVVLSHLRFFLNSVPGWVNTLGIIGHYAGIVMIGSLAGLLLRRLVVARVRYISVPSDYLMLLLFIALAGTGLLMHYTYFVDLYLVREFSLGLKSATVNELPASIVLAIHIALVAIMLFIFPFSKLVHAIGVFFVPSRLQRDRGGEL